MTRSKVCGNCLQFGGLLGTPLKRKYVLEKGACYCPKCKRELYMPEADYKVGDICPTCKDAKFKQKKRVAEYCPKCSPLKEVEA